MITLTEPAAFDITAPLPQGVTVLEASAGTGKTYTIAGLAARYVAEGTRLERILMVTFTRMATGELRERVRERLLRTELGLRQVLAAGSGDGADRVVEVLARAPREEIDRRVSRLRRALAEFDAATIATTHGFCQEVLSGLGIAADLEPEAELVEDLDDLLGEVLDDLYVRRALSGTPPFSRGEALAIARLAVVNPDADVVDARGDMAEARVRLARRVRTELEERKRRRAVMSYDDLLLRLAAALRGPQGPEITARLRQEFHVVLVDEFQDTDPMQWEIMQRAFGGGERALVLLADPKQAIYAFRGADIYAYLGAAAVADNRATLDVNRRSDQPLLDAFDALFGDARLGHEGIAYRRVQAAPEGRQPRFRGAPSPEPLRIRVVDRVLSGATPSGWAETTAARRTVADDVARDLVALLRSGAEVRTRDGWQQVCPGHVGVLVPRNFQAALVREALAEVGIPAVSGGGGSVFGAPAARHWLQLLEALERPASITRAHAVALSPFIGLSAEAVASRTEGDWGELHRRLHEWGRLVRDGGVAAVLEAISRSESLPARILRQPDGERELTDLRHVAQLLHAAAHEEGLGTAALAAWLRRRIAEAAEDVGDEDRMRRLESDTDAVQVLSIHRSKGLEFPIVLLPFLWDMGREREGQPVCFHDPEAAHRRRLDVALVGGDFERHRRHSVVEQRGEDLRLAYVALTRARHQAVVWWAGTFHSRHSPLSRLAFGGRQEGMVDPYGPPVPTDAGALTAFTAIAERAAGRVAVERVAPAGRGERWSPAAPAASELGVARLGRGLDHRWRRTSYSDLTAGTHEAVGDAARVASEPERTAVADEPEQPSAAVAEEQVMPPELAQPSLLAAVPVGTAVGTLVHEVLELTDFAAADLDAELARALAAAQARRSVEAGDQAVLLAGLRSAIDTPLGEVAGGIRLRDVRQEDRLDELEFELPLGGGDQPHGDLTPELIASVLREHLEPGDPMAGYAAMLTDAGLRQSVRGYLTGFLDLVVRLPGPRFVVIDYKTNWLAGPEEPLLIGHYRFDALLAEMERRHYALQALLYLVALHRYLRWRLPAYDPARHLAGVGYAFVRGMTPASSCGVFGWQPPPGLVPALSEALDRGGAA